MELVPFYGQIWRLCFQDMDPLTPASAPEGRFHHAGQEALYCSLSPEGCAVAIQRYLRPDDRPRHLVQLDVTATKLLDLRGPDGLHVERGINPSAVWQDIRSTGQRAPTWDLSDTARAALAQGMLYSSRTRPDLTHLVLFGANRPGKATLIVQDETPWLAPDTIV